jgi:hypothetical protein
MLCLFTDLIRICLGAHRVEISLLLSMVVNRSLMKYPFRAFTKPFDLCSLHKYIKHEIPTLPRLSQTLFFFFWSTLFNGIQFVFVRLIHLITKISTCISTFIIPHIQFNTRRQNKNKEVFEIFYCLFNHFCILFWDVWKILNNSTENIKRIALGDNS